MLDRMILFESGPRNVKVNMQIILKKSRVMMRNKKKKRSNVIYVTKIE